MKICFIAKKNDVFAIKASIYLEQVFDSPLIIFGERGEKIPEEAFEWKGDYLFSYLSPWIIPEAILNCASLGAINWHPGPPEYPGIGCTNFAIYNEEKEFGITCHYMLGKVDTGNIIEVLRFPIHEEDSVFSVTQKCYSKIYFSFLNTIDKIIVGLSLPSSSESWTRQPYKRSELNALCELTCEMSEIEIEKRIKATTYDRPWAFINLHGYHFFLKK